MNRFDLQDRIDSYPTRFVSGLGVRAGRPLPLGATIVPGGVNFSVYSDAAIAMTLVLYRRGEREPMAEIPIPPEFRLGSVYAITVYQLDCENIEYGYRAVGPADPSTHQRFDPSRVLADPYARLVSGRDGWGAPPDWSRPYQYRSRLMFDDFDWEDDRPLRLELDELVVYELHVRGFTKHASSGVAAPGTFAGLAEKVPYLSQLGVNAVELMPIFEFDEHENSRVDPASGERLYNYWGYSTHSFFAPKAGLSLSACFGLQADELKTLVKTLHRAGIEVILDVVFNHTAEGNEDGPTISFRGLDNATWYMLAPDGSYYNFSGTGNTLNCNHPVVRNFVLDCLRFWASEYHIDGFRFDLAAILSRDEDGAPLPNPPLLQSIAYDPVLRNCKLIAEAWDAGGLYEVGSFPAYGRWSEWNGRYRDVLRRFVKGDPGVAGEMAARLVGSPDLYAGRGPLASINFVTSHDGFTLADLVAYNHKHNEDNGEDNRDGDDSNNSWNCGVEGVTDDEDVLSLRRRQVRNMLALLLTSHGVPMLVAGDEVGRSQQGNNNAYCHDSPLSWMDWSLVRRNDDLLRFVRTLIAFRHDHAAVRAARHSTGRWVERIGVANLSWHGMRPDQPLWSDDDRLLVLMHAVDAPRPDCVLIVANMHWEEASLVLPMAPAGFAWHLAADTAATPPLDCHEAGTEPLFIPRTEPAGSPPTVPIPGRTVLVLVAKPSVPREESIA